MSITFVMAEFGRLRKNAGGKDVMKYGRLDPAYTEFKKYFPRANFEVYTDFELMEKYPDVKVIRVADDSSLFSGRRQGWVANDYYKVRGLVHSSGDVVVAIDSDIVPVSPDVLTLTDYIVRFGCVAPLNPRMIARVDNKIGGGGGARLECDSGLVTNSVPFGIYKGNFKACQYANYVATAIERTHIRLPVVMWQIAWQMGYQPCILPPQWCVCQEHYKLPHKIILHVGHPKIHEIYEKEYGGIKAERN